MPCAHWRVPKAPRPWILVSLPIPSRRPPPAFAARATRARADAQAIAGAVRQYQATFGALPDSIADLTEARTVSGTTGGPFLARVPTPPNGFTPYQYAKQGDLNFTVTSSGGGVSVTAP